MKKQDRQALQAASVSDLEKKVAEYKKEFSLLAMQQKLGKVKNVRMLSTLRKNQAFINTLITQKRKQVA